MSEILQNISYIALFIISSLIIIKTLEHFKMHIARSFFIALFCILLLYVPFYFGGHLAIFLSDFLYGNSIYSSIFVKYVLVNLVNSFAYVKFVSLITSVIAVIITIAAVIVSIKLAFKVVEIVRRYIRRRQVVTTPAVKAIYPSIVYILNNHNIYKRLLHLLN